MSNGYWGSKFPLGNLLCSKLIFILLAYRLTSRRLINALKQRLSPKNAIQRDTEAARRMFVHFFEMGYDKLNVGGGPKNLDGFVNIDFFCYPNVQRQIVADILDMAFIPDGCISQVHSNHVIEHVSKIDIVNQIRIWNRILKKGGLLTLRCPNALGAAYGFWFEPFIETQKEIFVQLGFPRDEDFGNASDRWVYKDFFGLVHWLYGDPGNAGNQHLNQLTPTALYHLLRKGGFDILKTAEPEALNIVVVARKATPAS